MKVQLRYNFSNSLYPTYCQPCGSKVLQISSNSVLLMSKYSSKTAFKSPILILELSRLSKTRNASLHSSFEPVLFHRYETTVFKKSKSTPVLFAKSGSKRFKSALSSDSDSLAKPKFQRMFLNAAIEITSMPSLSRSQNASYKSDNTSTGKFETEPILSERARFFESSYLIACGFFCWEDILL